MAVKHAALKRKELTNIIYLMTKADQEPKSQMTIHWVDWGLYPGPKSCLIFLLIE